MISSIGLIAKQHCNQISFTTLGPLSERRKIWVRDLVTCVSKLRLQRKGGWGTIQACFRKENKGWKRGWKRGTNEGVIRDARKEQRKRKREREKRKGKEKGKGEERERERERKKGERERKERKRGREEREKEKKREEREKEKALLTQDSMASRWSVCLPWRPPSFEIASPATRCNIGA